MALGYQDHLVSITENEIVFEHYYFPTGSRKVVRIADIAHITVKPPTLWNGKWRLHGTGNLKTWFPKDSKRFMRDRIFFAALKGRWVEIGFTVEDGARVEELLKAMHLL
ncbi:MAG: hypothetical protein HY911_02675 [Desulfobacterales bacterium]|nr:hypothetical protein [Desulfobacterales bacterium]